jgi:DNA repair exonuclease SbcCD nuclease subunit
MRVLLFSDLHAHQFKNYSTLLPDGRNSRLQDAVNILHEIKFIADSEKAQCILFGGDLFHIRPGIGTMKISTFNAIYDAIARLRVGRTVGLLVGNHDQGDRAGKEHSIYAFGSMVTVMDQPDVYYFADTIKGERISVFAMPAQSDLGKIPEIINNNLGLVEDNTIFLGHLPVAGGVVGCNFLMPDGETVPTADLRPDVFSRIFLGDFHKPQTLVAGIQYIGATHHHNWGDAGQRRGCLIWDSVEDTVIFKPLTSAPRFEKIPFEEWESQSSIAAAQNNFVRIVHNFSLTGKIKDEIAKVYVKNGAKVVEFFLEQEKKVSDTSQLSKFHPAMDYEEMVQAFIEKESPEDLDDDLLTKVGQNILNKAVERYEK